MSTFQRRVPNHPVSPEALAERAERLAAKIRERRPAHPLDVTWRCDECQDTGWRPTVADERTVAPCRHCNPVGHRRWREGHFAVDHETARCEECGMAARGDLKVGRDIDPVTGALRSGVLHSDA